MKTFNGWLQLENEQLEQRKTKAQNLANTISKLSGVKSAVLDDWAPTGDELVIRVALETVGIATTANYKGTAPADFAVKPVTIRNSIKRLIKDADGVSLLRMTSPKLQYATSTLHGKTDWRKAGYNTDEMEVEIAVN